MQKKAILIRIDPGLWQDLEKWAADEFRSLNGQIEYLLERATRDSGRRRAASRAPHSSSGKGRAQEGTSSS